jgi:hypothetical protein
VRSSDDLFVVEIEAMDTADRLDIGAITVDRIVEMEIPFRSPEEIFPDATAEALDAHRHWMGLCMRSPHMTAPCPFDARQTATCPGVWPGVGCSHTEYTRATSISSCAPTFTPIIAVGIRT